MFVILFLLPLLIFLSAIFLYRFSGKRTFLHLDLVQFVFSFIVYPLSYIWLKYFIYYLVRQELGVSLSLTEWVWIDTAMSILFLYFYAFGIIHALTKTFSLRLERDPLFDIFTQSEYFHEFLSHVGMYAGIFVALALIGLLNIPFPLTITLEKRWIWLLVFLAWFSGVLAYFAIYGLTNKGLNFNKYKRLMKLTYGICFAVLAVAFLLFSVNFSSAYIIFWCIIILFGSLIIATLFINPSRRIYKIFEHFRLTEGID